MKTGSNTSLNMLTPDDLAVYLRISKTGVYRLVENRQISFYRVGGSLRFAKSDILAYLSANRIEPVN